MQTTTPVLSTKHQELANAIWDQVIAACDAYFARHEKTWVGDSRAPEFDDDTVEKQFVHWDAYRADAGAMGWRGNTSKPYAYDFTALPIAWKRAVCQRAWALCKAAALDEDPEYRATVDAWQAGERAAAA